VKNKAFSILLSVVVAFSIWLYVVMVVNPEWEQTYTDIPVVFQNENVLTDRGFMIVSDNKPTVTLQLSGKRADLLALNSSNISVVCNLASIESSGEFTLNYSVYYANNAISVAGKTPESINLKVEKKVTKPVNVRVEVTGNTPQDYIDYRNDLSVDYPTIEVTGPQSVVDHIHEAYIALDINGKTQSISGNFPYEFLDADGKPVTLTDHVQVNTKEVRVDLQILKLKDLPIKVTPIYGGGVSETTGFLSQSLQQIKIAGEESILAGLELLEVGKVDLSKLLENQTLEFEIKLPEGVKNVTGVYKVTVTVEFSGLETKTLEITNFRPVNVPAGMDAQISNEVLIVTFRGPAAMMQQLTADDVVLEVDVANMEAGTESRKPKVLIDKYPDVGAVVYDNVVVELKPVV
jgi:YbbR domain-containing protein